MTSDAIFVRVLGDYGPFSTMGKSVGYQVTIAGVSFLVDCGSPLFQQIGGHGLKTIRGLIITHCHDDHKRWFSDLALFNRYAPDMGHKLPLYTSAQVEEGLRIASGPAIHTSLDATSKQVVDLGYDDYVDSHLLGPRPLYRIVSRETGAGATSLAVVDRTGVELPPERAKIVISSRNNRPRLLFKDPDYGEWVEPENFYPFSSTTFYEAEQNIHRDPAGFTIEALNAPVWHGMPGIGLRFRTSRETLVFSADTAHDTELWRALAGEKCPQRLPGTRAEFEAAAVLHGDINDFIERRWSAERLHEALHDFDGAAVIHDIATRMSVVHTDYRRLDYTVLGDAVNLASRLEGANKEYGTHVIIGPTTFEQVEDRVVTRELDQVRVKGKREPVKIHELISLAPATPEASAFVEQFNWGIGAYKAQRWDEAVARFREADKLRGDRGDPCSKKYIARCEAMRKDPPGPEWDGVFEMKTK